MTPNTIEKIVNVALHPTTGEEEAIVAFRQLHRNASKFGGLSSVLSGRGADLGQRLSRAENDAVELRANLIKVTQRFQKSEAEHREALWQMEKSRENADDAEARCKQKQQRITALETELAELKTNGADDELGIIDQHHAQIKALAIKLKALTQTVREAEANRDQFAAEKVAEARRKMRAALDEEDGYANATTANADEPQHKPEPAAKPRRKAGGSRKSAASASARPRARTFHANRRGADTDRLVHDLLTFGWKSVSVLFRAAQQIGFTGTENAIRFAAERLVKAGNAVQGRNTDGHIAFRRA